MKRHDELVNRTMDDTNMCIGIGFTYQDNANLE